MLSWVVGLTMSKVRTDDHEDGGSRIKITVDRELAIYLTRAKSTYIENKLYQQGKCPRINIIHFTRHAWLYLP